MNDFKNMLQGLYNFMLNVQVPLFGSSFSLWTIFMFGALGSLVVWFLVKFLK